ncbi:MAG: inositol monophosphatase [Acholeplasmataceae bacterium]|nr:inositol monophosphatase [Acholeplasmataceae bacterium]
MNYQQELDMLHRVVASIFEETEAQQKEVSYKERDEVVTSSDLYIEKELIKAIKKEFPNDHFHSEEYNKLTELKDRTWIIDPIDGTSNYVHHLDLFVNQIAFYDQGEIVLSYINVPRADKVFYAIKGEGAFLNGKRIHTTSSNQPNMLMSLVGISHKTEKDKSYFYKMLDFAYQNSIKIRMLGTLGYELAAVAEGSFIVLYTDVTNFWDIAPGLLLVREAGGIVLNDKGNEYMMGDQHMFCLCDSSIKDRIF